ncbi:GH1 family beta-glucosidase [Simiduia agarivorans]|uniref:Beta-glucosidase n=1 Tax=Simiduia agarivorans (strain DSM 21679 / JCM 13881 / BCRC 17597 / SA1) TaxID=1117647 RepID=K4KIJ3_SIMAS|nr:GH1 family beta-glucosidase [Simiduia agarivorans]AFU98020.1 beta-galactosidase [Simiduia agarivorans SA1 = DSM 21679]
MRTEFPESFLFGAATSSYQIEGATHLDGRGASIWDAFCTQPGNIIDASNGDIACDHYHKMATDVALMRELNLQAYRFSIAWPRIQPEGKGNANEQGLAFYDRLIDTLLAHGIAPYCTLYHWDLPLALGEAGGWLNRDTAYRFADYAHIIGQRFGDRIHTFATLNEPRCAAFVGHLEGRHAPGLTCLKSTLVAAHHMMLAHGMGIQALREETPAKLGIVLDLKPYHPIDDHPDNQRAARCGDGIFNHWFADPLFGKGYPEELVAGFGDNMMAFDDADLKTIAQPMDSLGINYYTRSLTRFNDKKPFPHAEEVRNPGAAYSDMGWEIYPDGLTEMLTRFHQRYKVKDYYIAENGGAFPDHRIVDGQVQDNDRTEYMQRHLQALAAAMGKGVPVSAYLAWSLMDNFEWGLGYTKRFGLVHVDYDTLARTPKSSAIWYRNFIAG